MPELPEVQTIVTGLNEILKGKTITNTYIYDDMVIGYPDKKQFIEKSKDKKIMSISRRGKYIIVNFDNNQYRLVIHLRMSGKLLYKERQEGREKHTHVVFEFNDNTDLRFNNVRKFGRLYFIEDDKFENAGNIDNLGLEPLSDKFSLKLFKEMLDKRKGMIKPLLMNQEFIAGIGNIYADEALFLAEIRPDRKANNLKEKEIKALYKQLRKILRKGIKMGGTSISDYVNALGETGKFQKELNVYQREGQKCKICGEEIQKKKISGRSTRFCPNCQK
ncbi:MAG: DNA-formamidopyrimidine glycosylase [Halanaerobiales bacterium]|nr:DNA-formamidopyrimidine glycosylase [Halanaerobiales bacterium]